MVQAVVGIGRVCKKGGCVGMTKNEFSRKTKRCAILMIVGAIALVGGLACYSWGSENPWFLLVTFIGLVIYGYALSSGIAESINVMLDF